MCSSYLACEIWDFFHIVSADPNLQRYGSTSRLNKEPCFSPLELCHWKEFFLFPLFLPSSFLPSFLLSFCFSFLIFPLPSPPVFLWVLVIIPLLPLLLCCCCYHRPFRRAVFPGPVTAVWGWVTDLWGHSPSLFRSPHIRKYSQGANVLLCNSLVTSLSHFPTLGAPVPQHIISFLLKQIPPTRPLE